MCVSILTGELQFIKNVFRHRFLVSIIFLFSSHVLAVQALHLDSALVQGPNVCDECLKETMTFWKETQHATTFTNLPRAEEARDIANKISIKRIKSGRNCFFYHFTSAIVAEKTKPITGITCESCHGAGRDWIVVYSEFGGKDVKTVSLMTLSYSIDLEQALLS